MATKVNNSLKVREMHLDLEEYDDNLGQSVKDHYDDIEYDAIKESINEGLVEINKLSGRQLALIDHPLHDWREIISWI